MSRILTFDGGSILSSQIAAVTPEPCGGSKITLTSGKSFIVKDSPRDVKREWHQAESSRKGTER